MQSRVVTWLWRLHYCGGVLTHRDPSSFPKKYRMVGMCIPTHACGKLVRVALLLYARAAIETMEATLRRVLDGIPQGSVNFRTVYNGSDTGTNTIMTVPLPQIISHKHAIGKGCLGTRGTFGGGGGHMFGHVSSTPSTIQHRQRMMGWALCDVVGRCHGTQE